MQEKNSLTDEDAILDFASFWFKFIPHSYQERFLKICMKHKRVVGQWCRQSGKSQSVAVYCLFKVLTSKTQILVIAPTQSQSKELYEKIRQMATDNQTIQQYLDRCTETEMKFKNGSRILSLPCGPYGATIRGYTADIVVLEEAQAIKDVILNTVIIPMLASKKDEGQIIKIGTPWSKNHFYESCYKDDDYSVIQVKWPEVVKAGQYSQKFIDEQKSKLLDIDFRTEYEAEFIDDMASFFPSKLVEDSQYDYDMIEII